MPLLVLYSCGIPKAKDSSAMRHCIAVKRLCVRCMVTGKNIISSEMAGERSVRKIRMINSRYMEISTSDKGSVEDVIKVGQEE